MKAYKADKASGIEANIFLASIIGAVWESFSKRIEIPLPFYSLTIDVNKHHADEWILRDGYEKATEEVIAMVKKQGIEYLEKIRDLVAQENKDFDAYTQSLLQETKLLKQDEFVGAYNKYVHEYARIYGPGAITFLYEESVSDLLSSSIAKRHGNVAVTLESALSSDYKSFMVESEELLEQIAHEEDDNKKEQLTNRYMATFYFMDTNYKNAPVIDKARVKERVKEFEEKKEPQKKSTNEEDGLTEEEKLYVEILKVTEPIRDKRKRINLIGGFGMFRFLEEASRRTDVSMKVLENLAWYEFEDFMNDPSAWQQKLKDRKAFTLVCHKDGKAEYGEGILVEEKNTVDHNARVIKGSVASKGIAKGQVRVVLNTQQHAEFEKGDILVAQMTRPEYLPLMKKAGAIVTDEGGLTSHAAIVSRELGIPCIIGAKVATQVLQNGEMVEVDANKGIITRQ